LFVEVLFRVVVDVCWSFETVWPVTSTRCPTCDATFVPPSRMYDVPLDEDDVPVVLGETDPPVAVGALRPAAESFGRVDESADVDAVLGMAFARIKDSLPDEVVPVVPAVPVAA